MNDRIRPTLEPQINVSRLSTVGSCRSAASALVAPCYCNFKSSARECNRRPHSMSAPIATGLLRIMALLSHWPPLCTCHTYCSYVHISITAVQRTKQLGRPCYHTIPASVIMRSSPQMLHILRLSLSLNFLENHCVVTEILHKLANHLRRN